MAVLTPAQQQVLDVLGRATSTEATVASFPPGLRDDLYDRLHAWIGRDVAGRLAGREPLYLSKHALAQVLGCETQYLADRSEPFEWSIAKARGSIVHKAVELSLCWRGQPWPRVLVDESIARLEDGDTSLARWLSALGEGERAQLVSEAGDLVAKFLEGFPPLTPSMCPVPEAKRMVSLFDGAVVVSGRVDLVVGRPDPVEARRVVIDFKTGMASPVHRQDLHLYALLEALHGLPPRMVATIYLDTASVDRGRIEAEHVTVGLLEAAAARLADGVRAVVDLTIEERAPTLRPGRSCSYCPVRRRTGCAEGEAHLAVFAEATA
jgi:hypothetical protein